MPDNKMQIKMNNNTILIKAKVWELPLPITLSSTCKEYNVTNKNKTLFILEYMNTFLNRFLYI